MKKKLLKLYFKKECEKKLILFRLRTVNKIHDCPVGAQVKKQTKIRLIKNVTKTST